MELMSSLLLCALTALLPPTSGKKGLIRDAAKVIESPVNRKTVWLSPKVSTKITLKTVMKTMQADNECIKCVQCMEKTIESLIHPKSITLNRHMPNRDVILNDILESYHQYQMRRGKRETETNLPAKPKKTLQVSKSKNVTVTKYNIDGQVYAIKIREGNATEKGYQNDDRRCQVYSVKKYHSCDSPKADLIFATAKRKANKRSKKQAKATLTTDKSKSTEAPTRSAPRAKVLAEPFMTSIEDLYN